MRIAVTGGLGFIGSAVVRHLIRETDHAVLNIDKGTYASTQGSVAEVAESTRYSLASVDVADARSLEDVFTDFSPEAVIHLAAETHVDRSIDGPAVFVNTNILGTYELLQASLAEARRQRTLESFRFLHVSTDEVFGSLGMFDMPFDEASPYLPRSPYSASKAASDHLVRAWGETYGLKTIVTNCSNNYGPFQFPEKLIPLMTIKAVTGSDLPVYGDGQNVRDWLLVEDHARAIAAALVLGEPGETYLLGGGAERSNLAIVEAICDVVDAEVGDGANRRSLISFVSDRPGHDLRYAVDASKAKSELGWQPSVHFEEGLAQTIRWYLSNESWWRPLLQTRNAGARLGTVVEL